jgi:hypothetical protein
VLPSSLAALFPPRSGYDHIDLTTAAFGADEPGAPIEHRPNRAVPLGHLSRVGLDLVLTVLAPNDKPELGSGSATQRHRRAGFGLHLPCGLRLGEISNYQLDRRKC